MTDTLNEQRSTVSRGLVEAYYSDDEEGVSLYDVYLEFILYWIKANIESYRAAREAAATREGKEFLAGMVARKSELFETFSALRTDKNHEWFESALSTKTSESDCMPHDGCKPSQGWKDIFNFAYRKELECLAVFEKTNHSGLDPAIRILLERAAEHARRQILYLDSRLFDVTQGREGARQESGIGGSGEQRALIVRPR